jgi:hypothetical protein
MRVKGNTIEHDCSTLGGNSGSVLLDFKTGKAIGIHHGGLINDRANLGVAAGHLRTLLEQVSRTNVPVPEEPSRRQGAVQQAGISGSYRVKFQVPIEVIINVGEPVQVVGAGTFVQPASAFDLDAAVRAAKQILGSHPDVLKVRPGYRFKNGWITDERVIVIEVRNKLAFGELQKAGKAPLPREILGVGVDVRTAALPDQLEDLGIVVPERAGKPAGYAEPIGYDDENSDVFLGPVKQSMNATFDVSPDAGFSNLKAFLQRVESNLTATMYEWEPNHISDVIEEVMASSGRSLRMVTQKRGVGEVDATESAVEDMKRRIGRKFKHVWASVRGPERLIPNSYHINVASRDGKEMWLSSGNWKESNQPENPTTASALRRFNREWHAIIENERLATLFQKYIEHDFREATRVPLEEREAVAIPDIDLFVPDDELAISLERIPTVTYEDELKIIGEELDIQPLLTPDRDEHGKRLFMKAATEMVRGASKSVLVQNQSFTLTDDNNREFDNFFSLLKQKQETRGMDVRIIFRDARDYNRAKDLERQQELIERLKDFGLDVSPDAMRLQSKCHTKGIIVDSSEVLLGSQNLTNEGSLFNRDASLLVKSPTVAEFYEKIFEFDWNNLAHNQADERVGGIRRAGPGEEPPPGFRRVKLSELLAGD